MDPKFGRKAEVVSSSVVAAVPWCRYPTNDIFITTPPHPAQSEYKTKSVINGSINQPIMDNYFLGFNPNYFITVVRLRIVTKAVTGNRASCVPCCAAGVLCGVWRCAAV